ncbi:helix-turn-helix transcriptional regulator [Corynebacterium pygosceleis]|uniref:helix-turn-helix transcriptional regulator n=1 Tax=Corynebacterium pygosceleis TaxID=2800406 RepID=UPI0019072DE9
MRQRTKEQEVTTVTTARQGRPGSRPTSSPVSPADSFRPRDGDTRRAILRTLLEQAPVSASDIGTRLGFSAAGVRRHLDILVEDDLVEVTRPTGRGRGRGRPAKTFRLTDRGRATFGHDYDSLAASALRALRETGGEEAVRAFARRRISTIVDGIPPADDDQSVPATAHAVADAFSAHGYAATVHHAGGGVQICQHHCPVSQVASEFPELCEAEHEAISRLLGNHVQPLASIAEGHGICTTNVPVGQLTLTPIPHTPDERRG